MTLYDTRFKLDGVVARFLPCVGDQFEPTVQRSRETPCPFAHLRLARGSKLSTRLIDEAAESIYGLRVVHSREKLELSYNRSVNNEKEAKNLIEAFVAAYNEAAERRRNRISISEAKQKRNRQLVKRPH